MEDNMGRRSRSLLSILRSSALRILGRRYRKLPHRTQQRIRYRQYLKSTECSGLPRMCRRCSRPRERPNNGRMCSRHSLGFDTQLRKYRKAHRCIHGRTGCTWSGRSTAGTEQQQLHINCKPKDRLKQQNRSENKLYKLVVHIQLHRDHKQMQKNTISIVDRYLYSFCR
jgi:hypothetical protein